MNDWKEYTLSETAELTTGFPFKGDKYEMNGKLKVVRGENITLGILRWDSEKYWNHSVENLEKYFLKIDDIVIGMDGSRVGQNRAIIRENELPLILAQRVARLRARNNFDQHFIWYHIYSKRFIAYVEAIQTGTSIPHISPSQINDFELLAPEYIEQKAISETLSSLDDKIDLLHRQNKTLEQLAETIFRQWFVEEVDTINPSKLENYIFFDPREKMDKQKRYQMFEMKCLSNTEMSIGEGVFKEVSSATTFRNGDTLLAKITPCLENGKTGFVMHLAENEIARGSTEFIVMRTKGQFSSYWVYCLARHKDFHDSAVLSMTGTSGRQRVQVDLLKSYEVKVDSVRMKEFHEAVDPHFQKIKSNSKQIQTLTQLRDALLPKLMSGEVRVNIN